MSSPKILWNLFHENYANSRGNKALAAVADQLPNTTFRSLYAEYPDFQIDVEKEQALLREHDLIIFQHPFYWYSTPALMKQWEDKVLTYGFAYPPKEGTALHGKRWLSVITTGGSQESYQSGGYNNYSISELLKPLQQTANLCGMAWLTPFMVHGVLPADYEGITATQDSELNSKAQELLDFLSNFDLDSRHSLEPVAAPHYFKKIEQSS